MKYLITISIFFMTSIAFANPAKNSASICYEQLEAIGSSNGVNEYEEKAAQKKIQYCSLGGRHYYSGKTYNGGPVVKKNYSRAFDLFNRACNGVNTRYAKEKSKLSCEYVSHMYYEGQGVAKNDKKSFEYAKNICPEGVEKSDRHARRLYGCGMLGKIYRDGLVVKKDLLMAAGLFRADCLGGENTSSCMQSYRYGKQSCSMGKADGCILVAKLYQKVKADFFDKKNVNNTVNKSTEYLKKACKVGSGLSCATVGNVYFRNKDNRGNINKGLEYYKIACKSKYISACGSVALYYMNGEGVKKDHKVSYKYSKIGCGSNGLSCAVLADHYYNGFSVSKSLNKALRFFIKSCDYGNTYGCSRTAEIYMNGSGVKKNTKKALKYRIKQCKSQGRVPDNYCERITEKDLLKIK